ncbi:matrixin family metalloprotease [uncultured Hymenobacter sp.]|uniref:matrixin family metalloprotease n=1 Tax=uncultured Hymenobacter sp. TaxID=170016 RepID=UPI0035CBB697
MILPDTARCRFVFSRGLGLLVACLAISWRIGAQPAGSPAGHCLLQPLAPGQRATAALIVEGQVLDAISYYDAARGRIFTRHRLRPFSILKGALSPADTAALTLLTEGGAVGQRREVLTNTLRLQAGEQGIFFLMPAPWSPSLPPPAGPTWAVYGSEQGFIKYDLGTVTGSAPFESYPAIDAAFYQTLVGPLAARRVLRPNPALRAAQQARQTRQTNRRDTQAATVDGLSPTQLTAGTGAVLTINGAGFGAGRGTGQVEFANADDGGRTFIAARDEDYLSWTDGQIQVRVPSLNADSHPAGSGRVRVVAAGQDPVTSPQALTILFAVANAQATETRQLDQPGHVALNGRGGLSFQLTAAFQASPAAAAWRRALTSWRCQTGINWDEDPTPPAPPSTAASDQRNVVSFDADGAALPTGVLGRTTTYYNGCFGPAGELVFAVEEIDMQFSSAASFQFGPAGAVTPQLDFETVAVHELGHAQQLSHIIRPGAVMHFGVARGQNTRRLDPASDVAGGRLVLRRRSFVNRGCGRPPMLPAPLTALDLTALSAVPTLSWSTKDECFLADFVVERSLSGDTLAWQALATLPAGRADGRYTFADPQPAAGLHYYRLRLRRPDGTLNGTLDSTAPLAFSAEVLAEGPQLFPNPVAGNELRFLYPASEAGRLIFVFYDELGRYHRAVATPLRAELNVLSLSVAGLRPGFYVLTWRDPQTGRHGSQRLVRL